MQARQSSAAAAIAALPVMLSARQVADVLGVHRRTWLRWARLGRVRPGVVVGVRQLRWPAEYVASILTTPRKEPPSDA